MTPIALTIAGSDSGGGAGIQADLKTFSALGVYGASVLTAVTAQNTMTVTRVEAVTPAMIAAQIAAVFDDFSVGAVKLGMLGDADAIVTVADGLAGKDVPVVLDPVMVAKSGAVLLPGTAIEAMLRRLLPAATIITPNLPEAARLLNRPEAVDAVEMASQGRALLDMGARAVLMKGGHGRGEVVTDLLVTPGRTIVFEAPRQNTRNTHGTGCSLAAAIAAGLAQGLVLPDAIARAHGWLQDAIRAGARLSLGRGQGPVHHFHRFWPA
ncbi:bifunctional hydroxymethylpyrimidine kinase/phosphomethylpyrimidine kinase [Halodurantibacterium flavum]|uniref:hydroxymethylpyrimidine kinase n=1 Tax=Halodurantibacterium flavum TaxID=1382802 RepID=A0ABW4SA94_9RHOB